MTTMFWILWFFIAFIIVLVAFTLRKETEEMPRREILRAVESTGGMGISERAFLWVFSWMDTRFRIQDYWNMSKGAYYNMHRQMPLTHAEKYKLRIIWYWYPLYCLGGNSSCSNFRSVTSSVQFITGERTSWLHLCSCTCAACTSLVLTETRVNSTGSLVLL